MKFCFSFSNQRNETDLTLISFFIITCQWKLQSLKESKGNDIHRNPSLFKRPKLMLHLWRDYYYYFCSRMRDSTNWYPLVALPGAVRISKILVGTSLCGGHNLSPLIGIGLSNLPKYGEDQSSYVPAALKLFPQSHSTNTESWWTIAKLEYTRIWLEY